MLRRNFTSIFAALIAALFLVLAAFVLGGCASTESQVGKAQARTKAIERKISANQAAQQDRLRREIFATRVALENHSLGLALDYNGRAQSIVGLPPAGQMADVRKLVEGLLSENAALREKAQRLDAIEVANLNRLQVERAALGDKREQAIGAERSASARVAHELGRIKDQVNSWFGLGAIGYGVSRFVKFVGIGCLILLIVLAVMLVFPVTAPVAGAAFGALWRVLVAVARWVPALFKSLRGPFR